MEVFVSWLNETGWKIFLILAINASVYLAITRIVPVAIKKSTKTQMKGRLKVKIEKRADTLGRIVKGNAIVVGEPLKRSIDKLDPQFSILYTT